MRRLALIAAAVLISLTAVAQDNAPFSPKQRQEDMGRLRDFFYPRGYTDEAIIDLENGRVPSNMTVPEFARLHCGEAARVVFNPCVVRSRDGAGLDYFVIALGGNKHFRDLAAATQYYRERVTDTVTQYQGEVSALNEYVTDFCAQIAAGKPAREILEAKGERPRINHAIAAPNPEAKFPFSNLFQWERCLGCVGIVAITQKAEEQPPLCGTVRTLAPPQVNYFVVSKISSRGHGSLEEALAEFARKADGP
jgi:hypothetical protein